MEKEEKSTWWLFNPYVFKLGELTFEALDCRTCVKRLKDGRVWRAPGLKFKPSSHDYYDENYYENNYKLIRYLLVNKSDIEKKYNIILRLKEYKINEAPTTDIIINEATFSDYCKHFDESEFSNCIFLFHEVTIDVEFPDLSKIHEAETVIKNSEFDIMINSIL